jgi:rhodanese-related sulfurtransferase
MEVESYRAEDLFEWVTAGGYDFTLLDVRNNEEFGRFKVEGPRLSKMINIPYIEFIEMEDESVAKVQVPKEESIRIVCAKEGSARFVGEILVNNGWTDVQILEGGIKTWGNMFTSSSDREKRPAATDCFMKVRWSCLIHRETWTSIKILLRKTVVKS